MRAEGLVKNRKNKISDLYFAFFYCYCRIHNNWKCEQHTNINKIKSVTLHIVIFHTAWKKIRSDEKHDKKKYISNDTSN